LKGHGFSRADNASRGIWALAPEDVLPPFGLYPRTQSRKTSSPKKHPPLPHSILLQTFTCKTSLVWKKIELEAFSENIEEQLTPTQIEIPKWNAQQFERLVVDGHPKTAALDCDGTLWGGDAGYGFMVWTLEQGLVSRSTSDWIDTRYRAYQQGQVSELEMCGDMVRIYEGLREQELRDAAVQYVEQFVRPRVFHEMASLVAALKRAGVEIWAVSSTNRWVVAEGVRHFSIPDDRVLAAEVRVTGGVITNEIVDVPTDEGKAATLKRIGVPTPDAAFGNSIHDLAMLEVARHAFPVNPSPALLEVAAKKSWGYFRPEGAEGIEAKVGGE
jgi:phosphoserine phosphatase